MQIHRWGLKFSLVLACALGNKAPKVTADDAAPVRPKNVPLDAKTKNSYVQYRGGAYRYPFSYPYYRNRPRYYPFADGPYGPYGSTYGGYSGNAYDSGVYGSRPLPDAPPAPPVDDAPAGPGAVAAPPGAPPAQRTPVLPPRQTDRSSAENLAASGCYNWPFPDPSILNGGEPVPYSSGSPFNPSFGGAQLYRMFPYGQHVNDLWFGHNRLINGYGYYPAQTYSYVYGPPSGGGYFGPDTISQYYNYHGRNFGPYAPAYGGALGGGGFYMGGYGGW